MIRAMLIYYRHKINKHLATKYGNEKKNQCRIY